jgi:hypothetical protein
MIILLSELTVNPRFCVTRILKFWSQIFDGDVSSFTKDFQPDGNFWGKNNSTIFCWFHIPLFSNGSKNFNNAKLVGGLGIIIIPTDVRIFFRGVGSTTNQIINHY